jgi:hypothetical protein
MRRDDLDRLTPDRAGGAEEGDPLHAASVGAGTRAPDGPRDGTWRAVTKP